jgi:hypothetical protein
MTSGKPLYVVASGGTGLSLCLARISRRLLRAGQHATIRVPSAARQTDRIAQADGASAVTTDGDTSKGDRRVPLWL